MAVDQKVSKWMRKHGPMRDGELMEPDRVAGHLYLELQKYNLDWERQVEVASYLFNAVVASRKR
jgi:uncharacterized membrane-anchored protein